MAFIMSLDQNAVSLQPNKFHAIPTLMPRWPLQNPLWSWVVTSYATAAPRRHVMSVLHQETTF